MTASTLVKKPALPEEWLNVVGDEFSKPYFAAIKQFLLEEKQRFIVYPPSDKIFAAFNAVLPKQVRVVILGQDPYHGPGQANGLCFSVSDGIPQPPSLKNIFKELEADLGIVPPSHGNLDAWTKQGVFLLNAFLTVRATEASSHQKIGWETFTDAVIKALSMQCEHIVFMLWGNFAGNKSVLIDASKHLILKAAHPSPFSAYNGFFGCKHFSKANAYRQSHGLPTVDWRL